MPDCRRRNNPAFCFIFLLLSYSGLPLGSHIQWWKQFGKSPQQPCYLALMKYFVALLPVAFSINLIRHFSIDLLLNLQT